MQGEAAMKNRFSNRLSLTMALLMEGRATAVTVDREQILGWNPEIVFLDAGNVELVRDDRAENGDFFDKLSAFNAGNVYQYPNSTSYYSNVEIPIAILFGNLARILFAVFRLLG